MASSGIAQSKQMPGNQEYSATQHLHKRPDPELLVLVTGLNLRNALHKNASCESPALVNNDPFIDSFIVTTAQLESLGVEIIPVIVRSCNDSKHFH